MRSAASIIESLENRRNVYALGRNLSVAEDHVVETVERVIELVPDAFSMKSARIVVALGENQGKLWDAVYDAFGGKVDRAKIDGFKQAGGTVLFFYDRESSDLCRTGSHPIRIPSSYGPIRRTACCSSACGRRCATLGRARISSITTRSSTLPFAGSSTFRHLCPAGIDALRRHLLRT